MSLVINNQHEKSVTESKEEKFSRFQPVKTRNFFVMCVINHLKFTRHIITSGYHIIDVCTLTVLAILLRRNKKNHFLALSNALNNKSMIITSTFFFVLFCFVF